MMMTGVTRYQFERAKNGSITIFMVFTGDDCIKLILGLFEAYKPSEFPLDRGNIICQGRNPSWHIIGFHGDGSKFA